jgi:3-hydroxyacyl-CoA dehydrogenase
VGIPTLLLDIVPRKLTPEQQAAGLSLEDAQVRNRIVEQGWKAVTKSRPPAVLSENSARLVSLGNLEDDFDQLSDVDWIVEAIVEKLEIKQDLFERIEKVRAEECIVSTNTSGLPINAIADGRGRDFQEHFLGTHFFNPPRWLKLLEIIPHEQTRSEVLDFMIRFGEDRLGKGIVVCKDTPNFIANRIFSIASAYDVAYALDHGIGIEEVDAVTGELIGRPKTATFRLRDLIGNDIAAHVGQNLYELIPDDETRDILRHDASVQLMREMIDRELLGNKTGAGFYKQVINDEGAKEYWVLDPESMQHEPPEKPDLEIVEKGRKIKDLDERFRWIVDQRDSDEASEETERLAEYLWSITAFALGYASRRVPEIADRVIDIDRAVKWGFAREIGLFEIWDAFGVAETVRSMKAEGIEVAQWVDEMLDAGVESFYRYEDGRIFAYYDLVEGGYVQLPEDDRILTVEMVKSEAEGVVKRNTSSSLIDMGDRVGLVEFHSKANSLDQDIFEMLSYAMDAAEDGQFDALVIGNEGKHFSAGANVFVIWMAAQQGLFDQIDEAVRQMQSTLMRMRYFPKPIVAAPHGMTLAGGAEVAMACSQRVAAAGSFIGLVELGTVGLVPAGSGTKETMRRVINPVMQVEDADPVSVYRKVFMQLATAEVSTGAHEAFELGYLGPGDKIVMNKDHLLAEAKRAALALVAGGYEPPRPERIYAGGRDLLGLMEAGVWGMIEAGWASEHDGVVSNKLAWVLAGGDITDPEWVPEEYILDLERQAFVDLCHEEKSQARMAHILEHNKPLRN